MRKGTAYRTALSRAARIFAILGFLVSGSPLVEAANEGRPTLAFGAMGSGSSGILQISGAFHDCTPLPIACNSTVTGSLAEGDCFGNTDRLGDLWEFPAGAGNGMLATLTMGDNDAYLYWLDGGGAVIGEDDDAGGGTDSQIGGTTSDDVLSLGVTTSNGQADQAATYSLTLLCSVPGAQPRAPTNLVANLEGPDRVGLSWNDNSNNEDEFRLEFREGDGPFTDFAGVAANSSGVAVTQIPPGRTFDFAVRASNGAGKSLYSNVVTISTPAPPPEEGPDLSGTYRIQVKANGKFLHHDGCCSLLVSTLYQPNDDFTRFKLERQEDGSYRVRGKASGQYLHDDGGGDRLLSTRFQPDDDFTRFFFERRSDSTYRIRVKATDRYLHNHGFNDQLVSTRFEVGPEDPFTHFRLFNEGGPNCDPNETTVCLNKGRFKASVEFRAPNGQEGSGRVVSARADDSGLFWFFNGNNWEMLLKVLNGCPINNHYWVFYAATTNVEFTLTVEDTETGLTQEYFNPSGSIAESVTDTSAFESCS